MATSRPDLPPGAWHWGAAGNLGGHAGAMPWDLRTPVDSDYFLSQGPPGPPGRLVRVAPGLVLCQLPLLLLSVPHCVPSSLPLTPTAPRGPLISALIPQPLVASSVLTNL